MTLHEEHQIFIRSIELKKQGKFEEATRLRRSIPIEPWLAEWFKKYVGAEELVKGGWNLSEAEAAFGKDWLTA